MANSSFQKNNRAISIPVTVPNGGTGRVSLDDKSILTGAGTGNVGFLAPGTTGNVLVSSGNGWSSGSLPSSDGSVTYAKLATDLVGKTTASTSNIDWSTYSIFTKTLSANTTFTFSNYQLNKVITLIITGNYSLSFPTTVKIILGAYDGTKNNYITLHCTKSTGKPEFWVVINN